MMPQPTNDEIPLISEHDSWISLDPVVGCPASCAYCFVAKHNLIGTKPRVRATPAQAVDALTDYLARDATLRDVGCGGPRLACMGNFTDMFMGANRDYALEYARLHHAHFPEVPLVFITKAMLESDTIAALDEIGHVILFFISQSFFRWYRRNSGVERGIASPEASARNWRLLAGTAHLKPLHYWRPLTWQNVPDSNAARRQLEFVRDAGALASVAVGLKHGDFLRSRFANPDHPLHAALSGQSDAATPIFETFPPDLRELVLSEARHVGHPTYLHTSCAASLALAEAEYLQTWRAPLRQMRCEPACCPASQRQRCDAASAGAGPSARLLKNLAGNLRLPEGAVGWNPAAAAIDVAAELPQPLQCRLQHVVGFRIAPLAVRRAREWVGTISGVGFGMNQLGLSIELAEHEADERLRGRLERLHGVTGLLSPMEPNDDLRVRAFSRFRHVRRVAMLALAIARRVQGAGGDLSLAPVRRLAWLHDINRWPFAHNAEAGHFDQAADLPEYFAAEQIDVSPAELHDLAAIHRRDLGAASLAGRAVLLADRAVGVVEDVLFGVTALGLAPERIPPDVSRRLGFFWEPDFCEQLRSVGDKLLQQRDVDGFGVDFDAIVVSHALQFLGRSVVDWPGLGIAETFITSVQAVKNSYLVPAFFPVANGIIGHGVLHRERIIEPLIATWRPHHVRRLTGMDDREAAQAAVRLGLITEREVSQMTVQLDCAQRQWHDHAFSG